MKKICLSGAFERNLGPESWEYERTILQISNTRERGVGVEVEGMIKPRINLRTTKSQERCKGRDFCTNCIFSCLLSEKRQTFREWVCNWVYQRVTQRICRRVFNNRICHTVQWLACPVLCKWVTRSG